MITDGNQPLHEPAVLLSLLVPALAGLYLLLTSTTIVIPGIWPYDTKRILQFLLLLIFFLIPLFNHRIRAEFANQLAVIPGWLKYAFLAIVALGVISVAVHARSTMHFLNSLSEVVLMSLLALAVVFIAACRRIGGQWFDRIVIGAFILLGLVVGIQELSGVLAAHGAGVEFTFRVSLLYFSWPRFYNQVQGWMLLPLISLMVLFPGNRLAQVIALLAISLQWYVILMTGARGLFVSVISGIFFALVLLPSIRRLVTIWMSAGVVVGALVYSLVLVSFVPSDSDGSNPAASSQNQPPSQATQGGHYGNEGKSSSSFYSQSLGRPMLTTSGRISDWKLSKDIALKNPWLGIGPNNYVCTRTDAGMSHPHNFPLQLAVEWGTPVAVTVCIIGLFLLKTAIGFGRSALPGKQDRRFFNLLLAGAFTGFTYSLLSGVLVMPASQVAGLLVCGVMPGLIQIDRDQNLADTHFSKFMILPLLALGLVVLGVFELSTMEARVDLLMLENSMYPRIWQDSMVCMLYVPS